MTYGELFKYLEQFPGCDHTLKHTLEFGEKHGLPIERLIQFVTDYGGYCDCEVLLNVAETIDHATIIGKETILTPHEFARQHDLWCYWDGAKCRWTPCEKDHPEKTLDLNRAIRQML